MLDFSGKITAIKDPAASNGVSNLQRCRAAGYLTLAAVAKCLQAATWLVARGNKNRGCSSWLDHTQTIAHENVKLLAEFYTSASLTTFLTRSTIDGATDSSSSPIRRNSSVSSIEGCLFYYFANLLFSLRERERERVFH